MSKLKLFVQPGWAEGKWQVKRFARGLPTDMSLTDKARQADVIVAHSAGGHMLPDHIGQNVLIVLIGVPYWPNRSIIRRTLSNIIFDAPSQIRQWGLTFWLTKEAWNVVYVMTHPWHSQHARKALRKLLWESLAGHRVLIVRNLSDPFCSPGLRDEAEKYGFSYAELPGSHEDCWFNPRPYIDLIRKELIITA